MATQPAHCPARSSEEPLGGPVERRVRAPAQEPLAVLGLFMVIILVFLGVFGPFLAPWPYAYQDLQAVVAGGGGPLPPGSPGHLLGTDQLGRDLLSRLLDGARISVSVALRRPARDPVHRRADRRDRRLVQRPPRQPADALHGHHLRLPRPAVHHPAVGGLPRDRVRASARRPADDLRGDRPHLVGDRGAASSAASCCRSRRPSSSRRPARSA